MPIKLLIADDQDVVRAGVKSVLADTDITVVAEAATGKEAVKLTLKHKPDVAMFDIRMPDGDGLQALGRVKLDLPDQPVLMFSSYDNPVYTARAVALGANGFILKTSTCDVLIDSIRRVAAGENIWTPQELRRMSGALSTPRHAVDIEAPLTDRELEVLTHLCNGSTNKEIAVELEISIETVKEHVQHVLRKLHVADRTQAAVWAVRKGIG